MVARIINISILGTGNFGYALLKHFDAKGDPAIRLTAYDRNADLMSHLSASNEHLYFHKGTKIAGEVRYTASPVEAVDGADIVVLAVTSDAVAGICEATKGVMKPGVALVNTAKALDSDTGMRLSEVCKPVLQGVDYRFAILAGGTIAADLFRHEPLGADIACEDMETAKRLADIFSSENLTVYPTTDLLGVEYASAFKNIISILAGIIKGMGYSYGSETHVITRAAHEIELIATTEYGASPETFSMHSQSWGNDMWMSCTGNTRNREFGVMLGEGVEVEDALASMARQGKTVEGVKTVRTLDKLPKLKRYPLMDFLYSFVSGSASLSDINGIIKGHRF